MKPSLRFLLVAVLAWSGVRAATLGVLPMGELLSVKPSAARSPPPIVATQFPAIEPIPAAEPQDAEAQLVPASLAAAPAARAAAPRPSAPPQPAPARVYYASGPINGPTSGQMYGQMYGPLSGPRSMPAAWRPTRLAGALPEPAPAFYSPIPPLDEWPLASIAAASMPLGRSSVVTRPGQSLPVTPAAAAKQRLDRLQLTAWALLRGQQGAAVGPTSLAGSATLGASQAGARLSYNFNRQMAATLRTSSNVGRRGGEVAAGLRIQPVGGLPLWVTAERRQRIGRFGGGRNAFALFFEGGVYQRPMPWHFSLDAYFQGGVVGFRSRDKFVDGGVTLTRPVYRNFSAGFGLWGGAQPGVYRVDAGPRISMKVRDNVRVHFDWRQRLAGKAEPGSGPAVTLATDF